MSGPTGRESDKFMLRLPDGMRDKIKAAADSNNRSMNAEIIMALELWLGVGMPPPQNIEELVSPEGYVSEAEIERIVDRAVRDALEKFQAALRK